MDRDTVINLYAKASTLAFMLFIPIIRGLKENPCKPPEMWELTNACAAAVLAEALYDLVNTTCNTDVRVQL